MRKVNITEFRKEVVALIEANRDKLTSFETKDDYSIFTFCGMNYSCEISLSDRWIGYDLDIETPEGMSGCGMQHNNDGMPIHGEGYEEIGCEIYDDLFMTVKAILNSNMYYSSNEKYSYTARKNDDTTYSVRYWERKKFLFFPYSSGWWNGEYSEKDFRKLNLNILS